MKLSFHRSQLLSVKVQKPGEIQAFVFDLALGIEGTPAQIDAQSGMLINLVMVDQIMDALRAKVESQTWDSLKQMAQTCESIVAPQLVSLKLQLRELNFAEKRGFSLRLQGGEWTLLQTQIVPLAEELYQVSWRTMAGESLSLSPLTLTQKTDLEPSRFFQAHPAIAEWTLENLQTTEKRLFRRS